MRSAEAFFAPNPKMVLQQIPPIADIDSVSADVAALASENTHYRK
jgi:hypothetical protein